MKTRLLFLNQCFDKNRLRNLISWVLFTKGEKGTIEIVEKLKELGFQFATRAGISLSVDDLKIPSEKLPLVSQANHQVALATREYEKGNVTSIEKLQQLVDTWHRTSETLKQTVVSNFQATDKLSPVYMMAFSGARGNISQVRQLAGMRGLMADPQGQIIGFPIRSNFREGLTLTEYMISCYGARKGLVDTALRTADAGYLTRRLVDVSQHMVVKASTCATRRGIVLYDLAISGKSTLSLRDRLIGRVLAQNVYTDSWRGSEPNGPSQNPNEGSYEGPLGSGPLRFSTKSNTRTQRPLTKTQGTNRKVGERNQEISASLASQIASVQKRVVVRSPLTCSMRHGVCQLCYGWSLSEGRLVNLGEAVGIIAAQSIGEPGTQLTMRTFHTGGVFSGDVMTEIRAPHEGIAHFPNPLQGLLIRTSHGKIAFLTKSPGDLVIALEQPGAAPNDRQNRDKSIGFLRGAPNPMSPHTLLSKSENKETAFALETSTVVFVRHHEQVNRTQLIAEFSSMGTEINETIEAKRTLFANNAGQISFASLLIGTQIQKNEDLVRVSRDLGFIWILSGKQPGPVPLLKIFQRGTHLVNKKTVIARVSTLSSLGDLKAVSDQDLDTVGIAKRDNRYSPLSKSLAARVVARDLRRFLSSILYSWTWLTSDIFLDYPFFFNYPSVFKKKDVSLLGFYEEPVGSGPLTRTQWPLRFCTESNTSVENEKSLLPLFRSYEKDRVLEEETLLSQSEPQEGKKRRENPKGALSMSSMTPFGGFLRGAIGFGAPYKTQSQPTFPPDGRGVSALCTQPHAYRYPLSITKRNTVSPKSMNKVPIWIFPTQYKTRRHGITWFDSRHLNRGLNVGELIWIQEDLSNRKTLLEGTGGTMTRLKSNPLAGRPSALRTVIKKTEATVRGAIGFLDSVQNLQVRGPSYVLLAKQTQEPNGPLTAPHKNPMAPQLRDMDVFLQKKSSTSSLVPSSAFPSLFERRGYPCLKTLEKKSWVVTFDNNYSSSKEKALKLQINHFNVITNPINADPRLPKWRKPGVPPQWPGVSLARLLEAGGQFNWIYCPQEMYNVPALHESINFYKNRQFDKLLFDSSRVYIKALHGSKLLYFLTNTLALIDAKLSILSETGRGSQAAPGQSQRTRGLYSRLFVRQEMKPRPEPTDGASRPYSSLYLLPSSLMEPFGFLRGASGFGAPHKNPLAPQTQKQLVLHFTAPKREASIKKVPSVTTSCDFILFLRKWMQVPQCYTLQERVISLAPIAPGGLTAIPPRDRPFVVVQEAELRPVRLIGVSVSSHAHKGFKVQKVQAVSTSDFTTDETERYKFLVWKNLMNCRPFLRLRAYPLQVQILSNANSRFFLPTPVNHPLNWQSLCRRDPSAKLEERIGFLRGAIRFGAPHKNPIAPHKAKSINRFRLQESSPMVSINFRRQLELGPLPLEVTQIKGFLAPKRRELRFFDSLGPTTQVGLGSYEGLLSSCEGPLGSGPLRFCTESNTTGQKEIYWPYSSQPTIFTTILKGHSIPLLSVEELQVMPTPNGRNYNKAFYEGPLGSCEGLLRFCTESRTQGPLRFCTESNARTQEFANVVQNKVSTATSDWVRYRSLSWPLLTSEGVANEPGIPTKAYEGVALGSHASGSLKKLTQPYTSLFRFVTKTKKTQLITNRKPVHSMFLPLLVSKNFCTKHVFNESYLIRFFGNLNLSISTTSSSMGSVLTLNGARDALARTKEGADNLHTITPYRSSDSSRCHLQPLFSTQGTNARVSPAMGEIVSQDSLSFFNSMTKATELSSDTVLLTEEDQISMSLSGQTVNVFMGQFVSLGENFASGYAAIVSGQVVAIEQNKITVRRTQPLLFYAQGVTHVNHRQWVNKNAPILTLTYQKLVTGDIVQGIPKIEQFFEAPATREGEPLPNSLQSKLRKTFHRLKNLLPQAKALKRSLEEIQQVLVEGILRVYLSQGVRIADKHLEIVIRQMTSKGQILDVGNTGLFQGEFVNLDRIERINLGTYGQKADYEPSVLGITQASLGSESFISAASFQETTRVLSRDTIVGKTDFLRGLKERVVLGDVIQAGTGLDDNINYGLLFGVKST